MATEIERKFIASAVPTTGVRSRMHIRQGYLAEDGEAEVRVRIVDSHAVLTVKVGRGRSRSEIELVLSLEQADELWAHTAGRRIDKVRHLVDLDGFADLADLADLDGAGQGLTAEVDVYEGALSGLIVVEVEFPSEDAADAFVAPEWFGPEVTGDPQWTNAALARHGRPSIP